MITENAVIKAGVATAFGTVAAAEGVSKTLPFFHTDAELKVVFWVVSGLLAVISLLLAAIAWFIRDMKNSGNEHHNNLYAGQAELKSEFNDFKILHAELQTQHTLSYNARGCAYDAERLNELIIHNIKQALQEVGWEEPLTAHRRKGDCPRCDGERMESD